MAVKVRRTLGLITCPTAMRRTWRYCGRLIDGWVSLRAREATQPLHCDLHFERPVRQVHVVTGAEVVSYGTYRPWSLGRACPVVLNSQAPSVRQERSSHYLTLNLGLQVRAIWVYSVDNRVDNHSFRLWSLQTCSIRTATRSQLDARVRLLRETDFSIPASCSSARKLDRLL